MMMMSEDQVQRLIHRWRNTREEDLQPDDYQHFKNLGSACLAEGQSDQLLKFIQDERNQSMLRSLGCVLVSPLLNQVVHKAASAEHCQAAVTYLTRTCRPHELLHCMLDLVEGIDPGAICETIQALLPHLQTAILRLDEAKAAGLGSALGALQSQLSRLPVPYTEQQEEEDEFGLCRCCAALTEFTRPFVEELKRKDGNTAAEDEELRAELVKFCMRSLREPLLEAQLNPHRKSSLWLFAVEIMVTLPAVRESLSGLLLFGSLRKTPLMDHRQLQEARACVAYLLFVQLITADSFPAVFSHVFILQCNMDSIDQLLSSKKESRVHKGLALFTASLKHVQDNSLPVSLLDLKSFRGASQNLRRVLTDCPIQHVRESGLQLLQLFINKLDAEAKHKFFRCMLNTSSHAGVESYIIKNIRNQLEFSTKHSDAAQWFLGAELPSLLRLVLSLPHGADTDLLSSMDRVMESLNLLRYILIRDAELRTSADVWDELCRLKDEYVKTLRVCIGISRAYYSSQLKALREDRKLKAREARGAARAPTFTGVKQVSSMTPEVQQQVLQSALVTFDLMESLVVRIEELTEEKLHQMKLTESKDSS